LPTLTVEHVIALLTQYVTETGESVDALVVGALALDAYGVPDRHTRDLDAELAGSLTPLLEYLTAHQIPADLTQNFSGWSIIAMPPGYRDRAMELINQPNLRVRVLSPVDFVIAKLRRGTELDLDDAFLVAQRHRISAETIRASAQAALAASPQDTALFLFQKTVEFFCKDLVPSKP
jgi:Nucleotidyltransferase of unknown function (DUF6036)